MEAKLIKDHDDYHLVNDEQFVIGTTDKEMLSCTDKMKLSLKNCQAIERGYDLDELATKYYKEFDNLPVIRYNAFTAGAKAILEILGDKKFSEEDITKAYNQGEEDCYKSGAVSEKRNKYIQALQQTEWEVEVVEVEDSEVYSVSENMKVSHDKTFDGVLFKYDADGCLILKRK